MMSCFRPAVRSDEQALLCVAVALLWLTSCWICLSSCVLNRAASECVPFNSFYYFQMSDTSLHRASLGNVTSGAESTECARCTVWFWWFWEDECLTNANSDRRTFSGTKSGSKRAWLHVCTHRRCGWWPQTGRNSSLSRCPSPASSPLPEEEDKTERRGFKDCATGLEHQRTHLDGWRGYLVDLISGGVFPHSHGQRGFVGHGYPQLHIRHAVKVLGHREEKVWSARLVADGRSRCDIHS